MGALSDNGDPLGYNETVTTKCLTNNIKRRNIGKRFVFENEAKTHPLSFAWAWEIINLKQANKPGQPDIWRASIRMYSRMCSSTILKNSVLSARLSTMPRLTMPCISLCSMCRVWSLMWWCASCLLAMFRLPSIGFIMRRHIGGGETPQPLTSQPSRLPSQHQRCHHHHRKKQKDKLRQLDLIGIAPTPRKFSIHRDHSDQDHQKHPFNDIKFMSNLKMELWMDLWMDAPWKVLGESATLQ